MFKKIYIEITNICNLSCAFCPGTRREGRFMSPEEFRILAGRLKGHTGHLYFHLMGEPFLHPQLSALMSIAGELGFRVVLTTNGTLLRNEVIAAPALHRVNISLQSYEANSGAGRLEDYISGCAAFARRLGEAGKLCSLRLWNGGGQESLNGRICAELEKHFPRPWQAGQRNERIAPGVFLESGEMFDWPDMTAADMGERCFCYGLRDHIGVLCDGTVVPCCLDREGEMRLGNLFSEELEDILAGPRARNIYEGFSGRRAREKLCRRCGYARRFG